MDILYRLFYTVFSMSCMATVILPLILLMRFCFRKLPRQFCVALWLIFCLRAVCPVGLSSPICLFGSWNRQFHRLLRSIGLRITPDMGLMTSWTAVYRGDVEAEVPYIICSVIGMAGALLLLLFTGLQQKRLRDVLRGADLLFDNVYQTKRIAAPLRTGIFRKKIFLPEGISAREMKDMLLHQQMHCERKDDWIGGIFFVVLCLHWWNPFLWFAYYLSSFDRECACDEAVVRRLGWRGRGRDSEELLKGYIQSVFNMKKEEGGAVLPYSLVTFPEIKEDARARHLLYLETAPLWKKGAAAFLSSAVFVGSFGLSVLHTAWNGGTWTPTEPDESAVVSEEERRNVKNEMIADCDVKTGEETPARLELMMTQGVFEKGTGYSGQCVLRLTDGAGDTLGSLLLSSVFPERKTQYFRENLQLCVEDYNGDGIQEVAIGQEEEVSAELLAVPASDAAVETEAEDGESVTVQKFYLINLEESGPAVASDPVYVSDATQLQTGSMTLPVLEGAGGVIYTVWEGQTSYYVWDEQKKMYLRTQLTEEQIQARKQQQKYKEASGEEYTHTLKDGKGKTVFQVNAVTDDTGGELIEDVIFNAKGIERVSDTRKLHNIKGYFRDLEWAQTDGTKNRFVVLSYNGTVGRTFAVYDLERGRICYRQGDGNEPLRKVFKKYNGGEITFEENGAVVYSLMDITGDDTLKVNFAANADGGVTVQGTFLYKMSAKETSGLQFSRNVENTEEPE